MKKFFGTDGIRGIANIYPITPEIALKLGKAVATVLKEQNQKRRNKVLIGKDTRQSGDMLEYALTSGLCSMGCDVLLAGVLPTPAVAQLTRSFKANAGFVISASHNPAPDNGIKIFSYDGFKLHDQIEQEIEKVILSDDIDSKHLQSKLLGRAYRVDNARERYIEYAKNTVQNMDFDNLKIIVDCANGAAFNVAPFIFKELCPDAIILNDQPDGFNINQNCGALYPSAIQKLVKETKADAGIAFDGDADRLIMCDEKGNELNGDHIMAICGTYFLKKNSLNKNTIVATQYSNLGLDEALKNYGGNVVRVLNGDRYVIARMRQDNLNLGGEASGHIIFTDQTTTGDGIISALQVLKIIKKENTSLSELAKCISLYPQIIKNISVKEKKDFDLMPGVRAVIDEINDKLGNSGRTLIRYSGTENKLRIMIEGKNRNEISQYAEKIAEQVKLAQKI
ncbi:Phosphoglucosamine mutase [Candidatus Magnetomoraceae bacterium gMMP-15]